MHQDLSDFIKNCDNIAEMKRGAAVKQDLEWKSPPQHRYIPRLSTNGGSFMTSMGHLAFTPCTKETTL